MATRAQLFGGGVLMLLGVTGCPITDDYFIDAGHGGGGELGVASQNSGGAQALGQAGKAQAGSQAAQAGGAVATAGSVAADGGSQPDTGGSSGGGLVENGQAGDSAIACVAKSERCNGYDDDCDGSIDEQACDAGETGTCTGFVTSLAPRHGYMVCTGTKDSAHAKTACQVQDMRLAWLESAEENSAVAASLKKLAGTADVLFGATDVAREGYWVWDGSGGFQFWQGNDTSGVAVNGKFNAWAAGAPNDANNEDCAIINSATGSWGDRSCSLPLAYLCEDP